MDRQTLLKSTLCLLIALVCNVMWAQTSADGPIVTFTNVQQDGTTYTLHINNDNVLATSDESAEALGDAAKFRATLQSDGTYTFYNESKGLYMIWRGKGEGHNSDKGVLKEYNADFCNWTLASGSNSKENTYFFYAKRNNTAKYGTLVLMKSNGAFDGWGETAAWAGNYSNLYSISGDAYTATLTDTKGVVHECTAKGLPLSGAIITNPVWKNGNLTAGVEFTIPVSSAEVTNRVIIGSFNDFNNKYFADGTSVMANRNSDLPFPSNVDAKYYLWAFYPTLEGSVFKFKIKNIGTGTYIKGEAAENDHSGDEVSLVAEAEATPFALTASNQLVNAKGYRLSNGSTSGDAIKYIGTYNTDHNGTKNKIVDANNYTLTLADGSTFVGSNGVHNLMGGSYTYTNDVWSDNGYSATVDFSFPFPVSTAEETKATLLANWGNSNNNSKKKWHAVLENGVYNLKVQTKDPDITELNTWKWAIYPQLSNGVFTFKIKNMHTGTYVYANPENTANAQGSKGYIVLKEEGTAFTIVKNGNFINLAYVGKNSTTLKLTTNGSGDTDVYLGSYAGTHAGNHINWPDLTVYSATIPATGYSAIYTPFAVSIPNGVEVYAGTVEGNWVIPSKISGTVIPTNTAVILKGTASTTYTFNKTEDAAGAIANNDLKGSSEKVSLTDEQGYILQADVEVFKLQKEDIAPYTAYITRPQGSVETIGLFNEGYVLANHGGFVNGGVYTFVTARGWMGAKNDNDNVISTAKTSHGLAGSDADPMFQWSVYKSKNGYYYLYNLGKKQFMGVQSTNNTSIPFADTPNNRKLTFKKSSSSTHPIMFSTDNAGVANHSADHGDGLITWTGGWNTLNDGGSNHQVTLVDKLTEANLTTIAEAVEAYEAELKSQAIEALGAAITTAQPKRNGMGGELGYYSSSDVNATTTFDAIVEFKNSITDETTINTIEGHTKTVNELFTLNVPQPGKFYRLKGISGNYIDATSIYNNANATSGQMSMKAEANANLAGTIFYLDEEKHFLNYATGTYVNQTREIGTVGNANKGVWSFNASPRTLGTLALSCTTTGNAGQNLHDNGGTRADRCDRNCGDRHDWTVEEVTTLPVTISAASVNFNGATKCVSTLFTPVALEVPVGITAYIGANEDNYLAMEPIEAEEGAEKAIIPANTGVILMADAAKTYDFAISPEAGTAIEAEDNIIAGTVAKTIITPAANTTCYVLAKKDEKVGLYRASLNKNDGKGFLNNACKAYIPVGGGQNAPALVMRFGRGQGTTEIELPTANGQQPTAVYDLQGRRVLNPTKGMYIINGKKVVIR